MASLGHFINENILPLCPEIIQITKRWRKRKRKRDKERDKIERK
jgi:hypothetical protein